MLSLFQRSLALLTDFAVCLPALRLKEPDGNFAHPPQRYNPTELISEPFLRLLEALDRVSYGPIGLEMPRWAMYDCGELPGMVAGYGCPAKATPQNVKKLLGVDEHYEGLVPLSMAIVIPQPVTGGWLCYSLCSINEIAPGSAPARLRLLTLVTLLARLEMVELWSIQQWRSSNLEYFVRLGPLRLMSAYTPAHTHWRTLTCRVLVGRQSPEALLMNPRPAWGIPTLMLDCDDTSALMQLQGRVERGEPVWVLGGPEVVGDRTLFPIKVGRPGEQSP